MRRVLAPLGGAISFLLVALLVIGGLTWVTVESLNVEQERRQATVRANSAQAERLALWRLDSCLFPAWGVENNRQYVQYFAFHAPFQVVVDDMAGANGEPPRVSSPLLCSEFPDWMVLHFQLDPQTGWDSPQVMPLEGDAKLRGKLLEMLALIPDEVNDNRTEALNVLRYKFDRKSCHDQLLRLEAMSPDDSPLGGVPYLFDTPSKNTQPAPPSQILGRGDVKTRWMNPDPSKPRGQELQLKEAQAESLTTQARGGMPGIEWNMPGVAQTTASQKDANPQPPVQTVKSGYEARNDLSKRAFGGQRGETVTPPPTANVQAPVASPAAPMPPPAMKPDEDANKQEPAAPKGRVLPSTSDEKKSDDKLDGAKPSDPAPASRGSRGGEATFKEAEKAVAGRDGNAKEAPELMLGMLKAEEKPADRPGTSLPDNRNKLSTNTVRPPTVQLGPMRPVWLRANTGEEALILVRAARLETKTVFQGVLLDWSRLQEVLIEEIKPQMPEAKLTAVRNGTPPSERAMTALPAVLDPGPDPPPPPAGWTPLRIGLTLGWVAALLGLAAVGFVGWTLIDLSERRIRFVSAVTHELRTPLTSLRLSTDLLASGMIADEEQQKQYLRTMGHESERLNTLIENVLDFAKLEKRTVQAHCAPLPLGDLLETVKATWDDRLTAEGRELVIVTTMPAEQIVQTDPRIASQILGNLIDNARKYTREAEDKRIWLWARPGEKNRIILEVEDRGPGVAASDRASIFRPFRRGQNVSATGGAGLGLALAKQWTDLLGGTITYRPADGGVGACFRLELPAC